MAGAAPGTTFGVDFNRLLELPRNVPNRLLELPNYGLWQAKSFLFYRPATAGCSLQTLQALRNVQTSSWSCHETKPAKPALGAAKLWAVAGQVFPFKRSETSKLAPGAATKPAKPNYGLWQAKSFLVYRPETAGCSLQTLQTLRNFQTGSWSCHETGQTGSWSCQTMGCGRPRLSFSTGPKLPDAPVKPSKRSETSNLLLELPRNLPNRLLELPNYGLWQAKSFLFYRPATAGCSLQTLQTLRNFQTGSWSCHKTCHTGSWSCQTMGCGRPSLSFSTGPKLPEADGNQDNLEWSLELALRGQVGGHLETSSAANPAHFQGLKKNMYITFQATFHPHFSQSSHKIHMIPTCLGFIPQFLLHSSQNCVNKKTPT